MYTSEMRHSNGCPSYLHHQYGMGACPAATPQSAVRWLAWTDEYGARYTSQGVERRHLRLNLGVEEVTGIRMDDWHLTIGLGVLLRDTLASSPEAKDRSQGSVKMRAYARRLCSGPVPYVAGRPCKQRESTRNRYGVTPASAFARHSEGSHGMPVLSYSFSPSERLRMATPHQAQFQNAAARRRRVAPGGPWPLARRGACAGPLPASRSAAAPAGHSRRVPRPVTE
jgi:hypothetical protein